MLRGILILIILLVLGGCEEHYDIHEYYFYDTEVDTDTATDCDDANICTQVLNSTCETALDGTEWIKQLDSCICYDGVQIVSYTGQVCQDGCVDNSNGVDWCVGYGPEDSP